VQDKAYNFPKLGADDGDECSEEGRQNSPVAGRQSDGRPEDTPVRPVDPGTGINRSAVIRHAAELWRDAATAERSGTLSTLYNLTGVH
jgi:hypothetical protein